MHSLPELFGNSLSLDNNCLTKSGLYLPYILPAEADGVRVSCSNPSGTNIVTCRDERLQLFMDEVGGLAFDIAPMNTCRISDQYIPIFDYRTVELASKVNNDVVGLTLTDILVSAISLKAGQYFMKRIVFRDADIIRRLCLQKKVILFLTGFEVLIETVWHQRGVCRLFEQLRTMGFYAVTGFNFSVFGGECPLAQSLNQKKSLVSSVLLEDHGLYTIPHIYAVNHFHIEKYQNWLKLNPHIRMVTINCQMQHSREDIEQLVMVVQALLVTHEKLHIILQGYWFSELPRLKGFLERVHIAESMPVKYGQMFKNADRSLVTKPGQYDKNSYKDLVINNTAFRKKELNNILRQAG